MVFPLRLAIVSAYCLGYFRALCLWLRDEALKAGLPSSDLLTFTRLQVPLATCHNILTSL